METAIEKEDTTLLNNAIKLVEERRYLGRLKNELDKAKKLMASLEKLTLLKVDLFSEVRAEVQNFGLLCFIRVKLVVISLKLSIF